MEVDGGGVGESEELGDVVCVDEVVDIDRGPWLEPRAQLLPRSGPGGGEAEFWPE